MTMRLGTIVLACMLAAVVPARAQSPAASSPATSATERARIKEIVREVLKENPELLLDAIQALETRERDEANAKTSQVIAAHRDQLERDARDPVGGNPKGDVTVVAFLDY